MLSRTNASAQPMTPRPIRLVARFTSLSDCSGNSLTSMTSSRNRADIRGGFLQRVPVDVGLAHGALRLASRYACPGLWSPGSSSRGLPGTPRRTGSTSRSCPSEDWAPSPTPCLRTPPPGSPVFQADSAISSQSSPGGNRGDHLVEGPFAFELVAWIDKRPLGVLLHGPHKPIGNLYGDVEVL